MPLEPPEVVAPNPRLDARQADASQLPTNVTEERPASSVHGRVKTDPPVRPRTEPPLRAKTDPPVRPKTEPPLRPTSQPSALKTILGTRPAVEDPNSPFAVTTSDGTGALDDDLPVAIAPLATPRFDPDPVELPVKLPPAPVAQASATRAPTPRPTANAIGKTIAESEPHLTTGPSPAPYPATLPSKAPPSRELFEVEEATSAREQRAVKTDTFALARPTSKKPLLFVLAALVVVAIVIFVMTRKSPDTVANTDDPTMVAVGETAHDAATTTGETPVDGAPARTEPSPIDPSLEAPPTEPPPLEPTATDPTSPTNPAGRPTGRPNRAKRDKNLEPIAVDSPPTPAGDGLADAKAAYNAGNQALYAANAAGAIAEFQAALRSAPNFAAAHRGLGLAYSLAGDRVRAVTEFKSYLAASPGARDTQKILERITALQAK